MAAFLSIENSNFLKKALFFACFCLIVIHAGGSIVTNELTDGSGIELPLYNKILELSCNSTDKTVERWEKDGTAVDQLDKKLKDKIEVKGNVLILSRSDRTLEGVYTCHFSTESKKIRVKAKPDALIESDGMAPGGVSKNVIEGDPVVLLCKLKNDNSEVKITWSIGEDLESSVSPQDFNTNITINETDSTSSLIIKSATFSDRAYYVCHVDNGIATTSIQILIRVKDKLAALWPFLGIVGEVVILCTVIFIYERRRNKPDFEESDNETDGKSPHTSPKGQDLRQRK